MRYNAGIVIGYVFMMIGIYAVIEAVVNLA